MKRFWSVLIAFLLVCVLAACGADPIEKDALSCESSSAESLETNETQGQKNAVKKAKSYLNVSAFSRNGLVEQLKFEGFTEEEATYGVEHCGADWEEQAGKKAQSYLTISSFSYSGLVSQLEFEGFSRDLAVKAADNCGADWKEQAAKKAKSYLSFSSFSRAGLIQQLEFEGFTSEEAVYGVEANGF